MCYDDPVPHESQEPHEHLAEDEFHDGGQHLPLHPHVTPLGPMIGVFIALLLLTALTVWAGQLHEFWIGNTRIMIGSTPHIVIAVGIATVKALLVVAFFMHLLWDKKVNAIVVASTIFAVSLFLGLTLMDLSTRAVISNDEVGEIYSGGDISRYRGDTRKEVQGQQGNIGEASRAVAGEHDADAHGEGEGEGEGGHTEEPDPNEESH